jgi:small subunit ribosomal protein S20
MNNRSVQSALKTHVKKVLRAIETKEVDQAEEAFKKASKYISKAASKGVIHRNTASRKISRLAHKVNTIQK